MACILRLQSLADASGYDEIDSLLAELASPATSAFH